MFVIAQTEDAFDMHDGLFSERPRVRKGKMDNAHE